MNTHIQTPINEAGVYIAFEFQIYKVGYNKEKGKKAGLKNCLVSVMHILLKNFRSPFLPTQIDTSASTSGKFSPEGDITG